MTDSNNKSLQILCKHWAETRKRQETNDVKLKAETFTQELATLDEIKNLYVNDEDYVYVELNTILVHIYIIYIIKYSILLEHVGKQKAI